MPSNRRMKNLLRKKKRSRRLASSGVRPVLSVPEADGTSSQASQAVEPAGAERLNVGDLVPFNDDGELLISSDSDTVSAMEPPSMAEASEAEMSLTGTDESNASIIANAPSTPQLFAFEDEDAAEPQSLPCSPQSPTIVEDDASSDSDAVLSVPQTPRLVPLGIIQTTTSGGVHALAVLESPSPISLFGNSPAQSGPRGLSVSPQRASSLGDIGFDPGSVSIPQPPPVFLPEAASRWGSRSPQMRPVPQTRVPPPMGPPLQVGAVQIHSPSRSSTPGSPSQTTSTPPPSPPGPLPQTNPPASPPPPAEPRSFQEQITQLEPAVLLVRSIALDDVQARELEQLPWPNAGGQEPWVFPGRDMAPSVPYSHLTLTHQEQDVFLLRVGGILFRVPARVAAKYPFWAAFAFMEQPPQGWSMPGVDPVIFVVLMDRVLATSELDGTEADLNLVKIFFAIALAEKWGMKEERNELRDAAYRYIVRRVLHSNPFLPDDESGVLDLSHFVYRSEELYRTWEAIQDYPVLQKILCESDLVGLYVRAIPQRFWVALTAHFKPEFSMLLHVAATVLTGRPEANFQHWWLRYFRMAGYLEADWLSCGERDEIFGPVGRQNEDPAAVQNWEEFQAARARGNALTAAFDAREGREQLAGPATPVTPANTDGDIYDATPRGSPSRCRRRSRVRFIHLPEVITPPQEGSRSQADIESSADDEVEDDEVEETDEAQEDGASSA